MICFFFFFKQLIDMDLHLSFFLNRNPIFIEGIYITLLILKEIPFFLSLDQMKYSIDQISHAKLCILNSLKSQIQEEVYK